MLCQTGQSETGKYTYLDHPFPSQYPLKQYSHSLPDPFTVAIELRSSNDGHTLPLYMKFLGAWAMHDQAMVMIKKIRFDAEQ
jgi:hypothetical protein